ncbi:MAG: hypothetical protein ACK41Y_05545 [Paracoccus hibiscisoli]
MGTDGSLTLSRSSEGMIDSRVVTAVMEGGSLRMADAWGARLYQRCPG